MSLTIYVVRKLDICRSVVMCFLSQGRLSTSCDDYLLTQVITLFISQPFWCCRCVQL